MESPAADWERWEEHAFNGGQTVQKRFKRDLSRGISRSNVSPDEHLARSRRDHGRLHGDALRPADDDDDASQQKARAPTLIAPHTGTGCGVTHWAAPGGAAYIGCIF